MLQELGFSFPGSSHCSSRASACELLFLIVMRRGLSVAFLTLALVLVVVVHELGIFSCRRSAASQQWALPTRLSESVFRIPRTSL